MLVLLLLLQLLLLLLLLSHCTTQHYATLYYTRVHNTEVHYTTVHDSTLHYTTPLDNYNYNYNYNKYSCTTPITIRYNYNSTTLHYNYNYNCTTPHDIQQLWVRWPLQPLQPLPETQLQPPFGPSVDSLCHLGFTTTNLSYRFPIFETSATALCGTTGMNRFSATSTVQESNFQPRPKHAKRQTDPEIL